jgi:hypothetical protein
MHPRCIPASNITLLTNSFKPQMTGGSQQYINSPYVHVKTLQYIKPSKSPDLDLVLIVLPKPPSHPIPHAHAFVEQRPVSALDALTKWAFVSRAYYLVKTIFNYYLERNLHVCPPLCVPHLPFLLIGLYGVGAGYSLS